LEKPPKREFLVVPHKCLRGVFLLRACSTYSAPKSLSHAILPLIPPIHSDVDRPNFSLLLEKDIPFIDLLFFFPPRVQYCGDNSTSRPELSTFSLSCFLIARGSSHCRTAARDISRWFLSASRLHQNTCVFAGMMSVSCRLIILLLPWNHLSVHNMCVAFAPPSVESLKVSFLPHGSESFSFRFGRTFYVCFEREKSSSSESPCSSFPRIIWHP